MSYTFTENGKTAIIHTSYGMGEGEEGYYVVSEKDESIANFEIPWGKTPEEEWSYLSDLGKDNVRKNGWSSIGKLENAIAAALVYVDFSEVSAEKVKVKNLELETRIKALFERFLNGEDSKLKKRKVEKLAEKLEDNRLVLSVWENLEYWTEGYLVPWNDWEPPTD